ncbi:MAG: sigma-70 family RNA polymerase sigma factor [Cyanobacteria bacterium]|nr:sigma-70 family RNA polymerase sigma factor [Cyanobacteriota bacterium]
MNPARTKSYPPAPERPGSGEGPSRNQRNRLALTKLASHGDPALWRRQRDALVRDNLPLVYAIAGRMSRLVNLPFEDLSQVGSLGLLRAIEAFKPSKGRSLSSFAVPYIRGAMQHELRDRHSLMKIPRELWELRRQATVLQERRRQERSTPLALPELAQALGCSVLKLQEALSLHRITDMRSLDAPARRDAGAMESSASLLESLADPASLDQGAGSPESTADSAECSAGAGPNGGQWRWLRQQLAALPQLEQALICGHLNTGATWVDLGAELGLHPRQAQRRYQAAVNELCQRAASHWPDAPTATGPGDDASALAAALAPPAVPVPAEVLVPATATAPTTAIAPATAPARLETLSPGESGPAPPAAWQGLPPATSAGR